MKDLAQTRDTVEWLGVRYRTILTAPGMSIVDTWSPAGSGPPRHIHADAEETFVLQSGRMILWLDGQSSELLPGQSVQVPRGVEHTFRVTDDGPARKLVILTPGGFEGFFAEMAQGGFAIPQDMGAIMEVARRYHLTFTGPPLAAG